MDREMMKALEADGEKLRQMTGEDHGPVFMREDSDRCQPRYTVEPHGETFRVIDGEMPEMRSHKEEQDVRDMRRCVSVGNWLVRCSGGRLTIDGRICPHCGSEDPDGACKEPMGNIAGAPQWLRDLGLIQG